MIWRSSARLAALAVVLLVCTCVADFPAENLRLKSTYQYGVRVAGGQPLYNTLGDLIGYYVFAEENAPLTPTPVLEFIDPATKTRAKLSEIPVVVPATARRKKHVRGGLRTRSMTLSDTVLLPGFSPTLQVPRFSTVEWRVQSSPFGSLTAVGPRRFYSTAENTVPLTGLRFRTAGVYNVVFNLTTITGRRFYFNRTIAVQRQPNNIVLTTTAAGYNGTAFDPAPGGQLRNFLGENVATSTAAVTLDFQASPSGAVVSGALTRYTSSTGAVSFTNVVPSLPGTYTYRLTALLSDGSTISTASQRMTVARALPVVIIVNQHITGIARFRFFTQPIFSIRDAAGPSQDTRMNMSLSFDVNQPYFSYEGLNTVASLDGTTAVLPVDYFYTFTDVSIDLPGNYIVRASLILPTGAELYTTLNVRIDSPPTFEIPEEMTVNKPGTVTLYGDRPRVAWVMLVLALDEACQLESSDRVLWPETETRGVYNVTLVPFNSQPSYVCMRIPSQSFFGPLIQRYLPQYDELFPLQYTFNVKGVTQCDPLTSSAVAQYQQAGWNSAAIGRRYGCALKPPVAGTIPACQCPAILTCMEMRHERFSPPNLDIGQCVCCTTWVMVVAGIVTGLFFFGVLWVIYQHV